MFKRIIRLFKIEALARRLDPRAFKASSHAGKRRARMTARAMFAAAEGQYDAIGGEP
jgi:hypothetical protein